MIGELTKRVFVEWLMTDERTLGMWPSGPERDLLPEEFFRDREVGDVVVLRSGVCRQTAVACCEVLTSDPGFDVCLFNEERRKSISDSTPDEILDFLSFNCRPAYGSLHDYRVVEVLSSGSDGAADDAAKELRQSRCLFFRFCRWIRKCYLEMATGCHERSFEGMMLYFRTRRSAKPGKAQRLYALASDREDADVYGDGAGLPVNRLPWVFATKAAASRALAAIRSAVGEQAGELRVEAVDVPAGCVCFEGSGPDKYGWVCSWRMLQTRNWDTRNLTVEEWLRKIDPQWAPGDASEREAVADAFAAKCDWEKFDFGPGRLSGEDWVAVLRHRPDLLGKCDMLGHFRDREWAAIMGRHSSYEIYRLAVEVGNSGETYGSDFWPEVLARNPRQEGYCRRWQSFTIAQWCRLLAAQPQFLHYFSEWHEWRELSPRDWVCLLKKQPSFAGDCTNCGKWKDFDGNCWYELLKAQPEFVDKIVWDEVDWQVSSGTKLVELLIERPDFVLRPCKFASGDCLRILNGGDWVTLLNAYPELTCTCESTFTWKDPCAVEDAIELIKRMPGLKARCNFESYRGKDLEKLLLQIDFVGDGRVPYERLELDNWLGLVDHRPKYARLVPSAIVQAGRKEWIGKAAHNQELLKWLVTAIELTGHEVCEILLKNGGVAGLLPTERITDENDRAVLAKAKPEVARQLGLQNCG